MPEFSAAQTPSSHLLSVRAPLSITDPSRIRVPSPMWAASAMRTCPSICACLPIVVSSPMTVSAPMSTPFSNPAQGAHGSKFLDTGVRAYNTALPDHRPAPDPNTFLDGGVALDRDRRANAGAVVDLGPFLDCGSKSDSRSFGRFWLLRRFWPWVQSSHGSRS